MPGVPALPIHLRRREGGVQDTTVVELFFDLVYVLAVTQLSHLLITHLSWAGFGHMLFLLAVVWWAWIYTTWLVNWFDPDSNPVRLMLIGVMLASLLMASALPEAFGDRGLLFAGAYVVLQTGRNIGGMLLLPRGHALRNNFERMVLWSIAASALWVAGGLVDADVRLYVWIPALAVDLTAPLVWYWTPHRGPMEPTDHDVEGGHFAERFQAFIIIALGESIVVTGATAEAAGLGTTAAIALGVAFLQTAALWWLYFGEVAAHSRKLMREREDTQRLARDAYTYLHVPIVLGIILSAVGDDLLIADPGDTLSTAGVLVTLAGPVLFLGGETLFRLRMIGSVSPKRITTTIVLAALLAIAWFVPALVLAAIITVVLTALALWEFDWGVARS